MKKIFSLTFALILLASINTHAQFRADEPSPYYYSGQVVNTKSATIQQALTDFFSEKVKMSHSYSMSFGAAGGSYQNVNAYTNTMQFMFSDRLQGRLDVSFLHSPFGGSNFVDTNNNLGGEIMIRNAELNYQISDNAHIKIQYQQLPRGYGYGFGGYNGYGSPFGYGYNNRFGSWY